MHWQGKEEEEGPELLDPEPYLKNVSGAAYVIWKEKGKISRSQGHPVHHSKTLLSLCMHMYFSYRLGDEHANTLICSLSISCNSNGYSKQDAERHAVTLEVVEKLNKRIFTSGFVSIWRSQTHNWRKAFRKRTSSFHMLRGRFVVGRALIWNPRQRPYIFRTMFPSLSPRSHVCIASFAD